MNPEERNEIFAGWWEYHRLSTGTRDERTALEGGQPTSVRAAYNTVNDVISEGRVEAVQFLADLNDAGPQDNQGEWVGAGPLEDLIDQHGNHVIDEIDRLARQSASFRRALGCVWFNRGTLDQKTEELLARWVNLA